MKLYNWTNDELLFVSAEVFKNRNNKEYYNIKVGSYTSPFIGLSIQLDNTYFKVTEDKKQLVLEGNDFYIKPYKNDKEGIKKDKFGNPTIILSKTKKINNDILIIPDFDIRKKTFKNFKLEGDCEVIAKAIDGMIWFDKVYKYDINLIYIYGDSKIEYEFIDNDNNTIIYKLIYKDNKLLNTKELRSK